MGRRLALLIGNAVFDDARFSNLPTSANDVEDFALTLSEYGDFDLVNTLVDQTASVIMREIEQMFTRAEQSDLVLLYYSGEGYRDTQGEYYLIAKDSRLDLIRSTGIPASFIHWTLKVSRCRQSVIILDSTYSGAFLKDLEANPGTVVLTSSRKTEMAFVGDEQNSIFTQYLLEGIRTGYADLDSDGYISVSDLFDYTQKKLKEIKPKQTPTFHAAELSTNIFISKSPKPPEVKLSPEVEIARQIAFQLSVGQGFSVSDLRKVAEILSSILPLSVRQLLLRGILDNYNELARDLAVPEGVVSSKSSNISSDLAQRLRYTLLRTHEFESNSSLRSVFVTSELRPWASRLPETESKARRVDYVLDYLISNYISDGRPVLSLFLTALRDRYPLEDVLHDEFDDLIQAVHSELLVRKDISQLPSPTDLIQKFATDSEDTIRAELAIWIVERYDEIGKDYEALLLGKFAQDPSAFVRQAIVDAVKSRFDKLPLHIRVLASQLAGAQIDVQMIKGSGMLVGKSSELILRIINRGETEQNEVTVELIQPSAEYMLTGDHKVTIPKLEASQSKDISFQLQTKVPRQIAVNYRINGELREPALYISAIKDNPYIYGNPIKEEAAFFGRQEDLDQIIQAVTKPAKEDILIVGERRTGKTSLLYRLQERLDRPFIPVYIVLNISEDQKITTESVLRLILEEIEQSLIIQNFLDVDEWETRSFKSKNFANRIGEIISAAKKQLADIKIVLLLDEADYLLKVRPTTSSIYEKLLLLIDAIQGKPLVDERLQNILRATLQSAQVGANLRAVVAGTTDLSTYISQRSSPFFNHFRFVHLKPLTFAETCDLITKPASTLGYSYSEDAIRRIIALSGGQPYYCQALCYESFECALQADCRSIGIQHVFDAETKITSDLFDAFLSGVWKRINQQEKHILSILTVKNEPMTHFTQPQVKRLLNWQIITESRSEYTFASELIRMWTTMAQTKG